MGKLLHEKFFYKPEYAYYLYNVPNAIEEDMNLPPQKRVTNPLEATFALIFVQTKDELKKIVGELCPKLDCYVLWVAYPKKNARVATDITRDLAWQEFRQFGFDGIALISINKDWTGVRLKKHGYEQMRGYKPIARSGKQIKAIPTGMKNELERKGLLDKFLSIDYAEQKVFVDAYNRAVKPETKLKRVEELIKKLKEI